ncbi:DUF309 domain-containing protein [Peribacillus saganii]|uniref:DUF309 domain-containing protein n=1 Tax=Peribacillus saganii TaxID=2303992 RepID=A0A372LPU3_9BACI|nr:DUF309 domain-containing protein [Peribacillus saganii]RFU70142.1 DUF309 domain-containing protein [Peribacillus saganii]
MESYPMEYYTFFISFNEGDYYTCHDLLEEMWMTDKGNLFLKGLLQLSVAIYHYEYGNVKGARSMLEAAYRYLTPYSPFHWGLKLEPVLAYIEYAQAIIPPIDKVPFSEVGTLPKLPRLYINIEN